MAYNPTYNLLGQKVSDTYPNLLQSGSDGVFYDGRGNSVTINATIPDIYATTGSNIFRGDQTITGSIYMDAPGTDSIYFSQSGPAGRLVWNDTDGTLDLGLKGNNVTLQIGQELVQRVVNKTNANLLESEYKVVRIRRVDEGGTQGQRLAVVLAQANNDANSVDTLGVVTENIADNQEGFITTSGLVRNIDTTGTLQGETWADGDVLYLSPTVAGQLTTIKPQAPQHTVIMGYVVYRHQNNGKIFVKVDNGYEIDELHNVRIDTGSLTAGQLLVRSGSNNGGVWINTNQLTGSYAITGSLVATSFTGSLQGTGSWAVSASQAISSSFARTSVTSSYPITATGTTLVSVLPGGASSGNNNSTFLGASAGSGVTSAYNSNFLGYLAGQSATFAYQSNFIGAGAGIEATRADNSNFFGLFAGQKAASASFSTLIGYQAGANPNGTATIGTNNIIIGNNITLPANTQNSINLGGIIFATGSYSTLGGNPYSGSQFNIGRVGINKVVPTFTLDVSGSGNYTNGLTVTGSLTAPSITGSLQGTASWANNATTASYVLNAISSSFALTASYADTLDGIDSTQFARVDIDNTFNGVNTTTQKTLRSNVEYVITETSISTNEIVGPDTQSIEVFNIYNLTPYTIDRPTLNTAATFDYTIFDNMLVSIRSGRVNLSWTPSLTGQEAITETQTIINTGESSKINFSIATDYTIGNEYVKLNVVNGSSNPIYIRGFLRII